MRPPASEMWLLARSDESIAADAGQQNILTHAVYAERASASTGHDPGRSRCTCLEDEVMVIVNAVYMCLVNRLELETLALLLLLLVTAYDLDWIALDSIVVSDGSRTCKCRMPVT